MELEVYKKSDFYEDYIDSQKEYYERTNADAYFAERLAEKDKEITELKQKLENVQASMYADVIDANMEIRRLKCALYKACANWAHFAVAFFSSYVAKKRWLKMERECLNKMEEYK